MRDTYPEKTIIAGNVVTGEMTEELIMSGADIVKVGIGQGSSTTTRKKTGVGYPQFSAVVECADAAHGLKGHIISDGGCLNPGDIVKSFGAGSDFTMLGKMLAGHDETGGDVVTDKDNPHQKYKIFYPDRRNSMTDVDDNSKYGLEEGDNILIDYKGPVEKRATFIKINHASNSLYEEDIHYKKL